MKQTLIFGVIIGVVLLVIANMADSNKISVYNSVKVLDKQQQQIIKGSDGSISTEIRYLVITDKGTFICKSNLFKGKFNNSDIFWHIQKDSIYSELKASGFGKGLLFDYPNIISIN